MGEKSPGDTSPADAIGQRPGEGASTAMLVASLVIFRTLGLPVRFIDMPSGVVALARGLIGAAAFYAAVMILNQFLREVEPLTKTVVQLAVAGFVLVPYVALTGGLASAHPSPCQIAVLVVVGVVHTGLAFALWFGSMGALSAQKVALLGYVDPIVALTISTVVLGETLTPLGAIGGLLVLGSVLASELLARRAV